MRGKPLVLLFSVWGVIGFAGAWAGPPRELLSQAVVLRMVGIVKGTVAPGLVLLGIHDVNGDGFPDLVVGGDRRVQVLFGDGQGHFSPGLWTYLEVSEYSEGQPIPGRTIEEFGRRQWEPYELEEREGKLFVPQEVFVEAGVLADLDGDGILDLAVRGFSTKAKERRLYLLHGRGMGEFVRIGNLPYPAGNVLSELWAVGGELFFAVAEMDKPARLYRVSVKESLGSPRLEKVREGQWILRWVGDLTGDGVCDLLIHTKEKVQVLVGDGKGGFREGPWFVPLKGEVQGVVVADLDGDGLSDLVVLTSTGISTALQREEGYVEAFFRDLGLPLFRHAVADLTGDGLLDLLLQRSAGFWEYYILPGDGRGGFLEPVAEFVVLNAPLMEPNFSDLNDDGLLDLVFSQFGGGDILILLNGGKVPGKSLHPLPGTLLSVGDFSGDGAPEILVADVSRRGVGVFWNNGKGGIIYRPLAVLDRDPLAGALAPEVAYVLLPGDEWRPPELLALDWAGKILDRWSLSDEALPILIVSDLDGDEVEEVAIPAKTVLHVLWRKSFLRNYPWPKGEASFLSPGPGKLWAISIAEYADLLEVTFSKREPEISPPILSLEAVPLSMTAGDLDGDRIPDPVVLAMELGVEVRDEEPVIVVERVVAGLVLSSAGPRVEEVPGFPKDQTPWPFLGAGVASFAGKAQLVYTTSAGAGVFLAPFKNGLEGPVTVDVPGGPIFAADLDGNGEDEVLTPTVGLAPLLAILWNGGGR